MQVWIYRDKATGQPKGDGTVTYEDPFTAGSAVSWFSGKEFKGEQCSGGGVPLQQCVARPGADVLPAVLDGVPCCDRTVDTAVTYAVSRLQQGHCLQISQQ